MDDIIQNIPQISKLPLNHVFETMKYEHKANTLWLEFGVASGRTINYISKFTKDDVHGFDSFEGLPEKWRDGFEKGTFNMNKQPPRVNRNVNLVIGWICETLPKFLDEHMSEKISFIHIDVDLYSSTKCILNAVKDRLDEDCIIVFDELINYPGYNGDTGELKALHEFLIETSIKYEWIGVHRNTQLVAIRLHPHGSSSSI